jgi:threonine/homoserine/homoserine lactone efflux protein
MNNAKNVGFKKGLKFNFGVLLGSFIIVILCLLCTSVLYNMIPKIQFPMKILGAAYMVYLIVKILLPSKNSDIKKNSGSFLIAILLSLTNPKAILFLITVISIYILPNYSEISMLLIFVFILALFGFIATVCWALFGSLFSMILIKYEQTSKIIMAILLLYCTISLFL